MLRNTFSARLNDALFVGVLFRTRVLPIHIEGDHWLTITGDILGTLRYMSPEQALGQRFSPASEAA